MIPLHFPSTLVGIVILVVGLLLLWVVVSVPVYFAGKALTGGRSDLGDAMGATLGGTVAYLVVYAAADFVLGGVIGAAAAPVAVVLALAGWLAAYKIAFRTSYARAVGIVLLSWVIFVVVDYVALRTLGVSFPDFLPFTLATLAGL